MRPSVFEEVDTNKDGMISMDEAKAHPGTVATVTKGNLANVEDSMKFFLVRPISTIKNKPLRFSPMTSDEWQSMTSHCEHRWRKPPSFLRFWPRWHWGQITVSHLADRLRRRRLKAVVWESGGLCIIGILQETKDAAMIAKRTVGTVPADPVNG